MVECCEEIGEGEGWVVFGFWFAFLTSGYEYQLVLFDLSFFFFCGQGVEFASSEISQTLRDFLEYLNRLNTFCTNLKAQIILAPYGSLNRRWTRRSRKN